MTTILRVGALALLLGFLALTVWSARTFQRYQPFAALKQASAPTGVELSLDDATIVGHQRGRRLWKLAVRHVAFTEGRRKIVAEGLTNGAIFDESGQTLARLSAARAEYQTPTGTLSGPGSLLSVSGGVRAELLAPRRLTLSADALTWNALTHQAQISGETRVTLPGGAGEARGENVIVDTQTGNLSVTRLRGTFRVP